MPKPVSWLWKGRIPLGKVTSIAGDPGLGKSMLGTDMAAHVSTGTAWSDRRDEPIESGGVVLLSAEDDVEDTIRPRLDAAGADSKRIVAIQGVEFDDAGTKRTRSFNLERDIEALEKAIKAVGECRLVVIDPVSAFMGKADSHKNAEVRGVLAPLAELAARHRLAVVAITHLTKAYGGKAMYRATGSLAFTAHARAAWIIVADKDNPTRRRLMLSVKNNLARTPTGLAYRIDSKAIDGIEDVPYLLWDAEPVTMTADEAVAAETRQDHERGLGRVEASVEWLAIQLSGGPLPSREVENRARDKGLSWASVRRAQERLGIKATKDGYSGAWLWGMPDKTEGAHNIQLSTFGEGDPKKAQKPALTVAPAEGAQGAQSGALSAFDESEHLRVSGPETGVDDDEPDGSDEAEREAIMKVEAEQEREANAKPDGWTDEAWQAACAVEVSHGN